ncbi:MAG: DegT/DnrJ/EryC1/StrS aminotransferase family protein [Candidatus Paceibacterota bacterium]|jgi:perosamine synthetase
MMIPLSQPDIGEKERKAVLDVLKTPCLALGPKLTEFEEKFSRYIGTKYAVAVNSGTSGLHLIVRALGIGREDEVITSPFSFIASANCILFENAKPVFVDIDPDTLNIDAGKIEKAITDRTKAIVAVDILGHPLDWDRVTKVARKNKLKIIEDSCEAFGAEYRGRKCGTFGEASVFAFYPNKQMTTGEGGMILTDSREIKDLCSSMANQGRKVENGKWLEHVRLGYNYRMCDINAALGIAQLSRINDMFKKRDRVAKLYDKYLGGVDGVSVPYVAPWAKISWFVYVIRLSGKYVRKDRDRIMEKLKDAGIQCSNYFQCIHLQPFYKDLYGYKRGDFPIAENISDHTVALPFYNNLSEDKIKYVVKSLKRII